MGDKKTSSEQCTPLSATGFVSGVLLGTVNTLMMKLMFETSSIGINGKSEKFEKPMFLSFIMFCSMLLALPLYFLLQKYSSRVEHVKFKKNLYFLMAIPAVLDLTASILGQTGLVYVTPSLYELIRSCVIIVTAILKVTALHQRLYRYNWIGVAINFVAMLLISAPTFLHKNEAGGRDPRIGVIFIMGSCIVQGMQYVFEEKVIKQNKAPALIVVGMEGAWGFIISLAICFPIFYVVPGKDKGSMENMWDAWVMLKNSNTLIAFLTTYFIFIALYNICAVYITQLLNSVWHAILENFRPIAVWGADLVIYYAITHGGFGEAWEWPGSYIQFAGMALLFFGTAVYNGSVPFLKTKKDIEVEEEEKRKKRKVMKTTP